MVSAYLVARIAMAGLLLLGATVTRASAQGGPGSQTVILPNPTPRPTDPHSVFRDDPLRKAQEQQAAALRRAQAHVQLRNDTRDILVLAQQILDHRVNNSETASGSDLQSAQQIVKLAKRVLESSKVQ